MGPRVFSALPMTTLRTPGSPERTNPVSGPGGHLVAWRGGLPATKFYFFIFFSMVWEFRFWVMKSMGVLQAPLSGRSAGTDTSCETRWNSRHPLFFLREWRSEREVADHLRDPANRAKFPAPLQGGGTWGIGPQFLPPPPVPALPSGRTERTQSSPFFSPLTPPARYSTDLQFQTRSPFWGG